MVDQERREQLLRKSKEISLLTDASLVGLMRAADRQIQSGLLPADRREDWIRENREEIEHGRHFAASNTAVLLSQKSVRIREDPWVIAALLKATTPDKIQKSAVKRSFLWKEQVVPAMSEK